MTGKTPWHLWIVGLVMTVWNGMATVDFTATTLQFETYLASVAQPVKDYVFSLPSWTFAVWGIATWSGLIGSLLLLLRLRSAVTMLLLSLAGALGMLVVALRYPPPAGDPMLAAVIAGVAALLLLYAEAMRRRGVLR